MPCTVLSAEIGRNSCPLSSPRPRQVAADGNKWISGKTMGEAVAVPSVRRSVRGAGEKPARLPTGNRILPAKTVTEATGNVGQQFGRLSKSREKKCCTRGRQLV